MESASYHAVTVLSSLYKFVDCYVQGRNRTFENNLLSLRFRY
jgi:hypothetical protein